MLVKQTQPVPVQRHGGKVRADSLPQARLLHHAEVHRCCEHFSENSVDYSNRRKHFDLCQEPLWKLRGVVCPQVEDPRGQQNHLRLTHDGYDNSLKGKVQQQRH